MMEVLVLSAVGRESVTHEHEGQRLRFQQEMFLHTGSKAKKRCFWKRSERGHGKPASGKGLESLANSDWQPAIPSRRTSERSVKIEQEKESP